MPWVQGSSPIKAVTWVIAKTNTRSKKSSIGVTRASSATAWILGCRSVLTAAIVSRVVTRPAVELPHVSVQPLGELLGPGERRQVAAVHLVGDDAEALADHPTHELGGEEPVVAAQQEPSRHVGPAIERVRPLEGRVGLTPLPALERLGDDVGRDVVEELGLHVELIGPAAVALGLRTPRLL